MNFFTFTAVALTYIKRIWSADIYTRWAIFFRRGVHGINFVSFFFNIKSDLRAKLTRWLTLSRDFTSIKFSYVYASAYACVASEDRALPMKRKFEFSIPLSKIKMGKRNVREFIFLPDSVSTNDPCSRLSRSIPVSWVKWVNESRVMSQWAMSQVIGQVSGFVWSISKKAGGRTDRQPRAKITLEHSYSNIQL